MMKKGIALGHRIFGKGIEVDESKIETLINSHLLHRSRALEVFWAMSDFLGGSLEISQKSQNHCPTS